MVQSAYWFNNFWSLCGTIKRIGLYSHRLHARMKFKDQGGIVMHVIYLFPQSEVATAMIQNMFPVIYEQFCKTRSIRQFFFTLVVSIATGMLDRSFVFVK